MCVGGRKVILLALPPPQEKEGASEKSLNPRPVIGRGGGDLFSCILIGMGGCPANQNKAKTQKVEM